MHTFQSLIFFNFLIECVAACLPDIYFSFLMLFLPEVAFRHADDIVAPC